MHCHLPSFVDQARPRLRPPVSNTLMFSGTQLKVMIVGGPNSRKDYHLNMGEELFFQLTGDMDLDIMDDAHIHHRCRRRRLAITEGSMFILPCCVPHSPQRYANTVGIVIERARHPTHEIDGLRYYREDEGPEGGAVSGRTSVVDIEFEKFFHCTDLGTQIKQAIDEYNTYRADLTQTLHNSNTFEFTEVILEQRKMVEDKYHHNITRNPARCHIREPYPLIDTMAASLTTTNGSVSNEDDAPVSVQNTHLRRILEGLEFMVNLLETSNTDTSPQEFVEVENAHRGEIFLWQYIGTSEIRFESHSLKDHLTGGAPSMEISAFHLLHSESATIQCQLGTGDVALLPSDICAISVHLKVPNGCDCSQLVVVSNNVVIK